MRERLLGSLCLLLGTFIWGSAFIAQRVGMYYIGPFTFQTIRCVLAAAFLFPVTFLFEKDKRHYWRNWKNPRLWKAGAICGAALAIASGLQQLGISYTSAGKAGFITAMYIVLVPILGLFLHRRPAPAAWLSVAIATVGLYLLSCAGVAEINKGDLLLLGCAFAFSVQITLIDRLSAGLDCVRLNCVQALACAILTTPMMLATETVDMSQIRASWLPLCYAGILSMGVAYTLQIVGQQRLEPTVASLIMSLESVIAALCGWLLLNESMSFWERTGSVLVFAAVILSQLPLPVKKAQRC